MAHYGHSEVWPNAIPFAIKYPEPDELSAGRQTEIKDYVDNAMKTLLSSGFKDPELGWRKYMDEASYIEPADFFNFHVTFLHHNLLYTFRKQYSPNVGTETSILTG